jgi:hypothetical protein
VITSGRALYGTIGPDQHRAAVVFGYCVDLADVLIDLAGITKAKILITNTVRDAFAEPMPTMLVDTIRTRRGIHLTTLVHVYEAIEDSVCNETEDEQCRRTVGDQHYQAAFDHFREHEFIPALQCLSQCEEAYPRKEWHVERLSRIAEFLSRPENTSLIPKPYFRTFQGWTGLEELSGAITLARESAENLESSFDQLHDSLVIVDFLRQQVDVARKEMERGNHLCQSGTNSSSITSDASDSSNMDILHFKDGCQYRDNCNPEQRNELQKNDVAIFYFCICYCSFYFPAYKLYYSEIEPYQDGF